MMQIKIVTCSDSDGGTPETPGEPFDDRRSWGLNFNRVFFDIYWSRYGKKNAIKEEVDDGEASFIAAIK